MMYSPLRYAGHVLWKKRPIQLTFFVTKKCNARCPFCFYLQKQDTLIDDNPELSLQEIESLSPSLGRLLWIAFSGGEVFLRNDIAEITEIFYKNNKPSIFLFSTNGLMPKLITEKTEEILKSCPNSVVTLKLSLDGLNGEHDALRSVPGSFERVIETHARLSELLDKYPNFELGINTVFCAANQDRIDKVFEFVKKLDHNRTHTLSIIRGKPKDASLMDVDLSKYQQAIEAIEKDMKNQLASWYQFPGARLKSAQDVLQRRLIYQTITKQRRMIPCYAGRLNLVLTEIGDVYPCELLDEKLGNVRTFNYDVHEVLQSEQAKKVIQDISKNQCYCSHECYFMTNILFNPRLYPMLIKEYRQLR